MELGGQNGGCREEGGEREEEEEVKHVIVIETVDPEAGGKPISDSLQKALERAVEFGVEAEHGVCFVASRFNVQSAIAAIHKMYGLP